LEVVSDLEGHSLLTIWFGPVTAALVFEKEITCVQVGNNSHWC